MKLQELIDIAENAGIDVDFVHTRQLPAISIRGAIAIDPEKYADEISLICDLAHELGHQFTGSFYGFDVSMMERRRCENAANRWAVSRLMPGADFNESSGDLARQYGVTQEFAEMAKRIRSEKPHD